MSTLIKLDGETYIMGTRVDMWELKNLQEEHGYTFSMLQDWVKKNKDVVLTETLLKEAMKEYTS